MNYKKKKKSIIIMMVLMTLMLCVGAISLGAYHSEKHAETMGKEDVLDMTIKKADTKEVKIGIQFDGDNVFITRGYYIDSYVFLIGWNKDDEKTDKYSTKADLELSDQSEITVCFDDSCKSDAKDEAVLSALEKVFMEDKNYKEQSWMSNAKPIVIQTLHVGTNLKQVAKNYYPKNDIWVFSTVFPELDSKLQKQYVKKAFDDDRIDVFAVVSEYMDKEEIKTYAKKSYDDDKIDFFAVVSEYMDKEEIKTYAKKSYDDDKIDFFSVLSDKLSEEEIKTYVKKAYNDDKTDFALVLSDNLNE